MKQQWVIHYDNGRYAGPYTTGEVAGICAKRGSDDICYVEDLSMKEGMDYYIEGMKLCSIKMMADGNQYSYSSGSFYMNDSLSVRENDVRRALQLHYTADRRRRKDWRDDVSYIVGKLIDIGKEVVV